MTDLLHFEDIETGTTIRSEPMRVTREAIIAFAGTYDPQPFHLDEAAGAASLLGGLAASGWQTAAIGMRLFFDCFAARAASMGSPGFDEVRWLRPVRPGDQLDLSVTVEAKRASASRSDRGFVLLAFDMRNAADETVMTQRGPIIVRRRDAAPAGAPPPPREPFAAGMVAPPPADPMLTAFYDEVRVGHTVGLGTQRFTETLIKDFARLYDPQSFHLDAEAAKGSHFGGLIASGWQTAAFWMKHYVAARQRSGEARAAAGLPVAIGGPSPGFVDMRWLRPVYPGDSLTYGLEIIGKRRAGRSGWGMITTRNTGHGADRTLAFVFTGRLLWPIAPA